MTSFVNAPYGIYLPHNYVSHLFPQQEVQELQVERKSHLTEIQNLREQVLTLKSKVELHCQPIRKGFGNVDTSVILMQKPYVNYLQGEGGLKSPNFYWHSIYIY